MECAPNIKAQIEMGTVHSADVSGLAQARYLHLFPGHPYIGSNYK